MQETLKVLGFQDSEIFQIVAIDKTATAASFTDPDDGWAWASAQSGNIYLVGNPLKTKKRSKASDEDIAVPRVLLLDADPEKTDEDPDGFSAESRASCLMFVRSVNVWMQAACGRPMPICDSGRGYQMWIQTDVADRRTFLKRLALTFGIPGVKVDATHDASRLLRLPGTVNTKTGRTACLMPT